MKNTFKKFFNNKMFNSLVIYGSTIYLLYFIPIVISELRFCQNGPHKMMESDCPGGFVFKSAIHPSCKYYLKANGSKEIVLSAPVDVCNDETARIIESSGDDMHDLDPFTWFMWEVDDSAGSGNASGVEDAGKFEPENLCFDECLPEWEDPNYVADEEPIPDDWDKSKEKPEDVEYVRKLNKKMFLKLLMDDFDDEPVKVLTTSAPTQVAPVPPPATPVVLDGRSGNSSNSTFPILQPTTPAPPNSLVIAHTLLTHVQYDSSKMNVIKLLAKSMKIALSACVPFLTEDFYEQVLKGMIFISKKLEGMITDVGYDLYIQVMQRLDHCNLKRQLEFHLNGTKCSGMEKVEGAYFLRSKEYWPYRLMGRSFRWGKYHPLLDAAWSTIDLVHSFCFESFLPNMMLGHVYEVAMEGLFPRNISLLWRMQSGVKNDKFWNNVMQTYDLNVTMKNLDACAYAVRQVSPFKESLPRPFLTPEELLKTAPASPTAGAPSKGWNKTIEKYWEHYENQGGFKKVSELFGKCFQEAEAHSDVKDTMLEALKIEKECKF